MIGSRLYLNPPPEFERSILVAGTARSGTTWLGDLIASQVPCRILFEPYNPDLVPDYRQFNYFQYMRPEATNQEFQIFTNCVLAGTIRSRWVDRQNERIFARYRLIKEIRANLSLKWIHDHFPQVPIVFIIRHPCAVVHSRMALGWATDGDIAPFLSQPNLIEDHLRNHLDIIKSVTTDEEKHAVIWSISNLVPLRQLASGDVKTVFYEDLHRQPENEIRKIFEFIRQPFDPKINHNMSRPSQTTRATSAVVTNSDRIAHWRTRLEPAQIENILRVVKAFGLEHLYGETDQPLQTS